MLHLFNVFIRVINTTALQIYYRFSNYFNVRKKLALLDLTVSKVAAGKKDPKKQIALVLVRRDGRDVAGAS